VPGADMRARPSAAACLAFVHGGSTRGERM
jgi:hypothetical protein